MEIEEVNLSKKLDSLVCHWLDFEDEDVEDFTLKIPDIVNYIPIDYYEFLAPFLKGDKKGSGIQQKIIFMEERQFHPYIEFKRYQQKLLELREELRDIISMVDRVAWDAWL